MQANGVTLVIRCVSFPPSHEGQSFFLVGPYSSRKVFVCCFLSKRFNFIYFVRFILGVCVEKLSYVGRFTV